ncbi:MAG: hypothetical protein K9L57_06035 [Spirochaetaceae bacterium]|nr:hypothetical protein [Spirochaetaceae bacterium]
MGKQLEFDFREKPKVPPVSIWATEENKYISYQSIVEKYLFEVATKETIQSLEDELNANLEGKFSVFLEGNGRDITISKEPLTVQTQFKFEINEEIENGSRI